MKEPSVAKTWDGTNWKRLYVRGCSQVSEKGNGMSVKDFDIVLSIRVLFPEAQIELDNEGQIIIYTGKYEDGSDGVEG